MYIIKNSYHRITNQNQHGLSFGNKKIPKFLYHLTTEENYSSMLKDKNVKTTCTSTLQGIFMIELNNFLKRWKTSGDWNYQDLQSKLLSRVAKKTKKIVVLRISTASLNSEKLLIRSQNRYFRAKEKGNYEIVLQNWKTTHIKPDTEFNHVFYGDIAKNSKHYKQRKEAIEYIYPESIDISKIEKVGSTKIKRSIGWMQGLSIKKSIDLFDLFKDSPEEKALVAYRE